MKTVRCLVVLTIMIFCSYVDAQVATLQDSAHWYYMRGTVKLMSDDRTGAIIDFNKSIKFFPTDSAYNQKGRAELFGRESLSDFSMAIKLNPQNAFAYYGRGTSKRYLGDSLAAMEDFNKAIKLQPDSPLAYMARGDLKNSLGQKKSALDDYTKAIQLGSNELAYWERGLIYLSLDNYKSAIADFDRAISLDSNFAPYYVQRAKCKLALQDKNGYCSDLSKAVELGDQNAKKIIATQCK